MLLFLTQFYFGSKTFFGPKILWSPHNLFGPKLFLGINFFWTRTLFRSKKCYWPKGQKSQYRGALFLNNYEIDIHFNLILSILKPSFDKRVKNLCFLKKCRKTRFPFFACLPSRSSSLNMIWWHSANGDVLPGWFHPYKFGENLKIQTPLI